jgi:ferritin-like metal-binding protein YciE
MPIKSTREKFVHELADLYDAEHQFLGLERASPRLLKQVAPKAATV